MLKTCFTFLLTRLSPAYKKNFIQTHTPPKKPHTTEIYFYNGLVTAQNREKHNGKQNSKCAFLFFFFFFLESEEGNKKK